MTRPATWSKPLAACRLAALAAMALVSTALVSTALISKALAHHAPPSHFRFDFRAGSVEAQLMLPLSELAYAMSTPPSAESLPAYVEQHVGARTHQGEAWTLQVISVSPTRYLDQDFWVARVELRPPARASARDFVFRSDTITHEVRNHLIMLVAERDYADPRLSPALMGALQYPVNEFPVNRPLSALRRPAPAPAISQ